MAHIEMSSVAIIGGIHTNEVMPASVANPCINICRMDQARKYCQGCGRTLIEIGLWEQMTEARRAEVVASLPARLPWHKGSLCTQHGGCRS